MSICGEYRKALGVAEKMREFYSQKQEPLVPLRIIELSRHEAPFRLLKVYVCGPFPAVYQRQEVNI